MYIIPFIPIPTLTDADDQFYCRWHWVKKKKSSQVSKTLLYIKLCKENANLNN